VASAFTPAASVISGGVICVLGAAAVTVAFPELWRFDAADETTQAEA
jgi:hypothetical protein